MKRYIYFYFFIAIIFLFLLCVIINLKIKKKKNEYFYPGKTIKKYDLSRKKNLKNYQRNKYKFSSIYYELIEILIFLDDDADFCKSKNKIILDLSKIDLEQLSSSNLLNLLIAIFLLDSNLYENLTLNNIKNLLIKYFGKFSLIKFDSKELAYSPSISDEINFSVVVPFDILQRIDWENYKIIINEIKKKMKKDYIQLSDLFDLKIDIIFNTIYNDLIVFNRESKIYDNYTEIYNKNYYHLLSEPKMTNYSTKINSSTKNNFLFDVKLNNENKKQKLYSCDKDDHLKNDKCDGCGIPGDEFFNCEGDCTWDNKKNQCVRKNKTKKKKMKLKTMIEKEYEEFKENFNKDSINCELTFKIFKDRLDKNKYFYKKLIKDILFDNRNHLKNRIEKDFKPNIEAIKKIIKYYPLPSGWKDTNNLIMLSNISDYPYRFQLPLSANCQRVYYNCKNKNCIEDCYHYYTNKLK